jgi:hypothetical protein
MWFGAGTPLLPLFDLFDDGRRVITRIRFYAHEKLSTFFAVERIQALASAKREQRSALWLYPMRAPLEVGGLRAENQTHPLRISRWFLQPPAPPRHNTIHTPSPWAVSKRFNMKEVSARKKENFKCTPQWGEF